jgi:hypothetical protein
MQGVQPFTVESDEESILMAFTTVGNHFPHAVTLRLTFLWLVRWSPPRALADHNRQGWHFERSSLGWSSSCPGPEKSRICGRCKSCLLLWKAQVKLTCSDYCIWSHWFGSRCCSTLHWSEELPWCCDWTSYQRLYSSSINVSRLMALFKG